MICLYKPGLSDDAVCSFLQHHLTHITVRFHSFLKKKVVQEVNLLRLKWFKNDSEELKGFLYLGQEKIGSLMCLGAMWGVWKCDILHSERMQLQPGRRQEFHNPSSCITGSPSYSTGPLARITVSGSWYWGSWYQDRAWEWKANIWRMRSKGIILAEIRKDFHTSVLM